jgi:hypothetical protein
MTRGVKLRQPHHQEENRQIFLPRNQAEVMAGR